VRDRSFATVGSISHRQACVEFGRIDETVSGGISPGCNCVVFKIGAVVRNWQKMFKIKQIASNKSSSLLEDYFTEHTSITTHSKLKLFTKVI